MNQKTIVEGNTEGEALVSKGEISFFGGVDPETGDVIDETLDIFGKNIKGKILVFKQGKGSTVGSYILYRMKKDGTAPNAILVEKAEPIIVVGCVLADIPLIESKDLNMKTGDFIRIEEGKLVGN